MNRRRLLKQIGAGVACLGAAPLNIFAVPPNRRPIVNGNEPVRLGSNENPYGPSPMAIAAMAAAVSSSNRYNWDTASDLITVIGRKNSVTDVNILIAAGSTEILDTILRLFTGEKGSFIIASPSYGYWTVPAEKSGLVKTPVPLTSDKRHDLAAMLAAIRPDTKFIYICNPNNPTGTLCTDEALLAFIGEATKQAMVIVDEAYIDFTNAHSVSTLAAGNKNLVVVKTFSKIYGLAGARIGYAIGHPETIDRLSALRSWANGDVSVVSRAAAIASLNDHDFLNQCYRKNEQVRKYTIEQLALLNIPSIPSHTNFVYFSLARYKKDYFGLLKDNNILGTGIYEEDGRWTRITIGTMEEMGRFIAAIK